MLTVLSSEIRFFAKPRNDDMQSATLLAYHRPGGLHRLMLAVASRTAHIRRFCAIPHRSSAPIGTAQSRRAVIAYAKKTILHIDNLYNHFDFFYGVQTDRKL